MDAAASLVLNTVDPENVGEVWLRIRRTAERAPINKSFIMGADRLRRIDEYRRRTRTRHKEERRLTFVSIEGAAEDAGGSDWSRLSRALAVDVEPMLGMPTNLMNEIMAPLGPRERAIAWCCWVDGVPQSEMAELFGLTRQRTNQIVQAIGEKLRRCVGSKYPKLREEMKAA